MKLRNIVAKITFYSEFVFFLQQSHFFPLKLVKQVFHKFPGPEEREINPTKEEALCFRSGHKLIYCSALKCRHSVSFPQDGKTSFNILLKSLLYILCCEEVTFTTSVQSERGVSHKNAIQMSIIQK